MSAIKKLIKTWNRTYGKGNPILTDDNSFEGEATCMNCGHHQTFKVPKGKTPVGYASKIKCNECQNNEWRVRVY